MRKINQEDFLHDIVSVRQYQRYRNGVSIAPIEVINSLANRLNIETRNLLSDYEYERVNEKNRVERLYNTIASMNLKLGEILLNEFNEYVFISTENKKLFDISVLLLNHNKNQIDKSEFSRKLADMINYPEVLKYSAIRETEEIGLALLYQKSDFNKEEIIIKFVDIVSDENKHLTGQSFFARIRILIYLSKYYGSMKEFDKVILYCNKALEILKIKHSSYNLHIIYYHLASANYYLDNKTEFEENAYFCLVQILQIDSIDLQMSFKEKFLKYFNIDMYTLMHQRLKNLELKQWNYIKWVFHLKRCGHSFNML